MRYVCICQNFRTLVNFGQFYRDFSLMAVDVLLFVQVHLWTARSCCCDRVNLVKQCMMGKVTVTAELVWDVIELSAEIIIAV